MNLNVSGKQPAFNAHFKLKAVNPNALRGISKIATGAASIAGGAASAYTVFGPDTQSVAQELTDTTKDVLMSKPEGADLGIPVQSTILPSTFVYSGIQLLKNGKRTLDLPPNKNDNQGIPS